MQEQSILELPEHIRKEREQQAKPTAYDLRYLQAEHLDHDVKFRSNPTGNPDDGFLALWTVLCPEANGVTNHWAVMLMDIHAPNQVRARESAGTQLLREDLTHELQIRACSHRKPMPDITKGTTDDWGSFVIQPAMHRYQFNPDHYSELINRPDQDQPGWGMAHHMAADYVHKAVVLPLDARELNPVGQNKAVYTYIFRGGVGIYAHFPIFQQDQDLTEEQLEQFEMLRQPGMEVDMLQMGP